MQQKSAEAIIRELWGAGGFDEAALGHLQLRGAEPVLPSSFRVDALAQTLIAASALAAAEIHYARGGERQDVSVDIRHAAAEFRSERYLRVNGAPAPELWDKIAGVYQCGDGRWVRIHTNFKHHRDGVLRILACGYDRDAVAKALGNWKAEDFENAAAEVGLVVAMMRSFEEWDAHPQGQAIRTLPLFTIEKIGEAEPQQLHHGSRPLSGIRVLDLTRVIAGPVCGRTLAAYGAEVMLITAPHLPSIAPLVIDTGRGKLSAQLDLRNAEGRAHLRQLVAKSNIFVQAYRPGGVGELGFSPEELAEIRPGIICASLSAYGHLGPWSNRRGFDSLTQTATGLNHAEAEAAGRSEPMALPCQALDHGTGYLMAFAVLGALMRQSREGGSWHVRVSLAQTAHYLRHLGRLPDGLAIADQTRGDIAPFLEESASGFGRLSAIAHSAKMSRTPPHWDRPSVALGTHSPIWP